jgi:hypothetical protein
MRARARVSTRGGACVSTALFSYRLRQRTRLMIGRVDRRHYLAPHGRSCDRDLIDSTHRFCDVKRAAHRGTLSSRAA